MILIRIAMTRNDEYSGARDGSSLLPQPSDVRNHEVAVGVRHLLGFGIDGFGSDGYFDLYHRSGRHHPVVGIEQTLHLHQCVMLLLSQGGCLFASQFEARQLREKVEVEHPFHRCKSYVALQVKSQALLSSWETLT